MWMKFQISHVPQAVLVCLSIIILTFVFINKSEVPCLTLEARLSIMSSHGWRVWHGSSFITEEHHGERVCVPTGWRAIGAITEGSGWAEFKEGGSAILAHTDLLNEDRVILEGLSFPLSILSPRTMAAEDYAHYKETIIAAFTQVAQLYPTPHRTVPHTVLITVGLGGKAQIFEDTLYPDPSSEVSMLVRDRTHKRSTELFIHAVAHLFNRYMSDGRSYLMAQSPFPASDFEEMEAAWSEIAFLQNDAARRRRLDELYAIHRSVVTGTTSVALMYPFDDALRVSGLSVHTPIVPEGSNYIDYQYAHYVLAPLIMVGIDGMLSVRSTGSTVEELLYSLHSDPTKNFFLELRRLLGDADIETIMSWVDGTALVSEIYLKAGVSLYEQFTEK
jgi:hypothetical protein